MSVNTFPTSRDIFIEIDGKKVAIVESYRAKSSRESRYVEAFGEDEPVGTISGRLRHIISLSRVYATKSAISDGIDFHTLDNFNLVIVKPDSRIIYTGCRWADIEEQANLNDVVLESVTVVASKRMELL
ncbi:MAG: hypothetical protein IJC83_01530 [Oscillospiraceae bacterium]|nr:hypothetical protein [Oscillospiraceae bacterium]